MKLEDQVCTLEQAKKLAELGVKVNGYFYWCEVLYQEKGTKWEIIPSKDRHRAFYDDQIPAYTVAELGEMLPLFCSAGLFRIQAECWKTHKEDQAFDDNKHWEIIVDINDGSTTNNHFYGQYQNEAKARAEALIWLLEQELVTADEINKLCS